MFKMYNMYFQMWHFTSCKRDQRHANSRPTKVYKVLLNWIVKLKKEIIGIKYIVLYLSTKCLTYFKKGVSAVMYMSFQT